MIRLSLVALIVSGSAALAVPQARPAPVAVASTDAVLPGKLALRPELHLARDLVTFGDLIPALTGEAAATPAFRAPALGETGTIQVARIVEAARAAGILREGVVLASQGFAQVVVTRAARRIIAADLEAAVKTGLQERFGVDARVFALAIDGGAPAVSVEPELTGEVAVVDLTFDSRTRGLRSPAAR
jgi:flagella basal body P-ring formation protein FlgA